MTPAAVAAVLVLALLSGLTCVAGAALSVLAYPALAAAVPG